jgi:hypothetical protein
MSDDTSLPPETTALDDRAYEAGWKAGEIDALTRVIIAVKPKRASLSFVGEVLLIIVLLMYVYVIAYLVSAGWSDGKIR